MLKASLIFGLFIIAHSVDASVSHGRVADATIRFALSIKHHLLP
jgi:hypothetical protein